MGALYLVLVIGEFATFYGQFYLMMMVAQYSLSDLRLALFRHVERLPMAFFDRTPVGRLVSRMTTDIDAINEMFTAGSLTIFIDLLTLAGIVAIMFTLSPRLALWALCAIPPLTLVIYFLRASSRVVYREIRDRLAALNAYLSESLGGMAMIQLFTRERESRREFDALNLRRATSQMMANIYEAGQFSSVEALSSITVAMILWIGGGRVIRHLVIARHAGRLYPVRADILHAAARYLDQVHRAAVGAGRGRADPALMEGEQTIASPGAAEAAGGSRGAIVFDHVNFEYRRASRC